MSSSPAERYFLAEMAAVRDHVAVNWKTSEWKRLSQFYTSCLPVAESPCLQNTLEFGQCATRHICCRSADGVKIVASPIVA